jgi:hypothetical protein
MAASGIRMLTTALRNIPSLVISSHDPVSQAMIASHPGAAESAG